MSLKSSLKTLLGNFCEKCINIPCIPVTKMFKKIKSCVKRVEITGKKIEIDYKIPIHATELIPIFPDIVRLHMNREYFVCLLRIFD